MCAQYVASTQKIVSSCCVVCCMHRARHCAANNVKLPATTTTTTKLYGILETKEVNVDREDRISEEINTFDALDELLLMSLSPSLNTPSILPITTHI